jgi:diguanylate cyclase (GGDEF)-like protein
VERTRVLTPGLVRGLLRQPRNPYAGADLANARRLVGVLSVLSGVLAAAYLGFGPPTAAVGAAGWAIAAVVIVAEVMILPLVLARRALSFPALLAVSYAGLASIALLNWLMLGDAGDVRPVYDGLILLWLGAGVGVHPPRRALPILLAAALAAALPLIYDGWNSFIAKWVAIEVLLWWALGGVIVMLMSYVRAQRIGLAAQEAKARDSARVDVLTGLGNRLAFEEALEAEIARSRRAGSELSVVMLDLDGLKAINDASGHPEGDRCLRELAGLVRKGLRASDRPFRWGGDEFMVLMPDTGPETARAAVQRVTTQAAADGAGPSFSFGVAALAEGTDAQELMALADRDLLECKSRRRSVR